MQKVDKLGQELSAAKAHNRALMRSQGVPYEHVVADLKTFLSEDPTHKSSFQVKAYRPPKKESVPVFDKEHTETSALVLSDWHLSEVVRPSEVNGINRYNSIIAANRIYEVVDRFKRITRAHQSMYTVEGIWIPVLGDMISGSIHPELVVTNDLMDIPATVLAARLLIMAIYEIKTLGLPIRLDCKVGNHGRTALKMPTKRQNHTSFDWFCYVMLQEHFSEDLQVQVHIHDGQFGVVDIYKHRIVIEHGYGAPLGKERELESHIRDIFDNPAYRAATGLEGTAIDYLIIGDKHQAKSGEGYMVNGSTAGTSELSMSWRLRPISAIQQMIGITRSRIPSFQYQLDVSDIKHTRPDNPLSDYTKKYMEEYGK